jgi:hypothetical protein
VRHLFCGSMRAVTVIFVLQARCCQHQAVRETIVPVVSVKFSGKRAAKTKKAGVVMPLPFDDADM